MVCTRITRWLAVSAIALTACTDDLPWIPAITDLDAGLDADSSIVVGSTADAGLFPPDCPPLGNPLPRTLACTGLYGAIGTAPLEKAVHPTAREFKPAAQLWTDGAEKRRWILLPEGSQIDSSNPNSWKFPDGTRLWKEFKFAGKRAETRFMYKNKGTWDWATYQWNETDTEAVRVESGAVVPLASGAHDIPNNDQCRECHRGAADRVLGFQHVLLGLPCAEGLTLSSLVAEKRLTQPPPRTSFTIPDDGTRLAAEVLPWLHVNCGVGCHNESGDAKANGSKMFLRIDATTLEDGSPGAWNIVKLTVGMPTMTALYAGAGLRIAPGAPEKSVIVTAVQTRGSERAMPPLGTRIVDPSGLALVREWITRLGGTDVDPGAVGAGGLDAGALDAATGELEASTVDADLPDAQVGDADAAW